jgi:hypothetical protein
MMIFINLLNSFKNIPLWSIKNHFQNMSYDPEECYYNRCGRQRFS